MTLCFPSANKGSSVTGERASRADGVAEDYCSFTESRVGIIVHVVLRLVPGKRMTAEIQIQLLSFAFVCSELILCHRGFKFGFGD